MTQSFNSFTLYNDRYDGVIIKDYSQITSIDHFENDLNFLIQQVKEKKLLWIKLHIKDAEFIPLLTKLGFVFHHCNENDITLVKKLINNPIIPTAKNHTLGVGAVVIDGKKLLVIKERIGQRYKLPGGHIDDKENISTALVREVYEETGVSVAFESIVCLGHFTPGQFEESNLYVVCQAKPLSKKINIQDPQEIIEACWMDIDMYLACEEVYPYNKKIVLNALKNSGFKVDNAKGLITKEGIEYELFS